MGRAFRSQAGETRGHISMKFYKQHTRLHHEISVVDVEPVRIEVGRLGLSSRSAQCRRRPRRQIQIQLTVASTETITSFFRWGSVER